MSAYDSLLSAIEKIAALRAREHAILTATAAAIREATSRGNCGVVVDLRPEADPIAWTSPYVKAGQVIVLPDGAPMRSWDSPIPIRFDVPPPPAKFPRAFLDHFSPAVNDPRHTFIKGAQL